MYDLTMSDVQLIVEVGCKGTKIFRITQVLNTNTLIYLHNPKKSCNFAAKSCKESELNGKIGHR